MEAKRKLRNFDFSGNNHAVALVHKDQGGAANGYQTLVMKSTDVVVELSMAEFLTQFFNMWDTDAQLVARMLGYSDDIDMYDPTELEQKVTLLRDLMPQEDTSEETSTDVGEESTAAPAESSDATNGQMEDPYVYPLDMGDLGDRTIRELRELTKALADSSNVKITDFDVVFKNTDGVSVSDVETPNEVNKDMTTENVEMIEKSAVEQMISEEIEKAVSAAKEESLKEHEEIVKALKDQIEEFEAQKREVEKAAFVAKAKEFEILGVEDFEGFGVALMKMAGVEEFAAVEEVLSKAVNIAKNASVLEEQGHSVDTTESELSGVQKALAARAKK